MSCLLDVYSHSFGSVQMKLGSNPLKWLILKALGMLPGAEALRELESMAIELEPWASMLLPHTRFWSCCVNGDLEIICKEKCIFFSYNPLLLILFWTLGYSVPERMQYFSEKMVLFFFLISPTLAQKINQGKFKFQSSYQNHNVGGITKQVCLSVPMLLKLLTNLGSFSQNAVYLS